MAEHTFTTDFVVFATDDTEYYFQERLKEHRITKVRTHHLTDLNWRVCVCEITPSYECVPYDFGFDMDDDASDEERDAAYEWLSNGHAIDNDVMYIHVDVLRSMLDSIPAYRYGKYNETGEGETREEAHEKVFEQMFEHVCGNDRLA